MIQPRSTGIRWQRILLITAASLLMAGCQTTPDPAASTLPGPEPAPAVPGEAAPGTAAIQLARRDSGRTKAPASLTLPTPEPALVSATEIFSRLRDQLDDASCNGGDRAAHWQRRYAGSPTRFADEIKRSLPLLAFVLERIEERELPGEFAFIPIVESWYRADAVARGGPAGMWQMIPTTARGNGILITEVYDGRYSPLDATTAALDHLGDLHDRFGDWRLAAMAYNAGEYRVARAIRSHGTGLVASGEARQPAGLAPGTYEYVSKLKALSCLLAQPQTHRIDLPDSLMIERLAVVDIDDYRGGLDTVARVLDLDPATLRMLNGGYRNGRIDARSPQRLLVPMQAALDRPELPGMLAGHTVDDRPIDDRPGEAAPPAQSATGRYTVQRGDTLSVIARRHGLSLSHLLGLNGLRASSIIRPGQVLKLEP